MQTNSNNSLPEQRPSNNEGSLQPPRFLDQLREALRIRHYSYRTEKSYIYWIIKLIVFNGKRHPKDTTPRAVRFGPFICPVMEERLRIITCGRINRSAWLL